MKKKFLSVLLCGALILGATGTFTSCKDYQDDIDNLQEQVDANKTSLSGLQSQLATLESTASNLQSLLDAATTKIADAQAVANEAKSNAANAQAAADAAQSTADQAVIDAANAKSAAAQAVEDAANAKLAAATAGKEAVAKAKELVDSLEVVLQSKIDELQNMIDSKVDTATFNEALKSVHSEIVSSMNEVNGRCDALQQSVDGILSDLKKINDGIKANADAIQANAADIKANADSIGSLKEKYFALDAKLEEQQQALKEYEKLTDHKIDTIKNKIQEIETYIQGLRDDIAKNGRAIDTLKDSFNKLQNAIDQNVHDINDLKTAVSELKALSEQNEKDIDTLKSKVGNLEQSIKDINTHLSTLDTQISTLTHRVAGLTFVPTTYVHGVPAIMFQTIWYQPWAFHSNGLLYLPPSSSKLYEKDTVHSKTYAFYSVDPNDAVEKVTKENTTGLFAIATNVKSPSPQPSVSIENITPNDDPNLPGTIKVELKKLDDTPFLIYDGSPEEFWQMAIQTVTDKVSVDDAAQYVTSDWARLYDVKIWRPYIHNSQSKTCNEAIDTTAHFFDYDVIHDAVISTTGGNYIIDSIPYSQPLDLNTLVKVCDKHEYIISREIAENNFGLTFSFQLKPYTLQKSGEDPTDQAQFAKIDPKTGVITSRGMSGAPNNVTAIGREPLIEVRLMEGKNIVDVRYFKIKWIAAPVVDTLGLLDDFTGTWHGHCNEPFSDTVGTEIMNTKVYEPTNYSKDAFHLEFTLDPALYKSFDAAKKGISTPALGTLSEISTTTSSTTYNIVWDYTAVVTGKEYDHREAVRKVWGRYVKFDNSEIYIFELRLTLNIPPMKMIANVYNLTYWLGDLNPTNWDKTFSVNPILESDALYGLTGTDHRFDCMILGDIMKGYSKIDGVEPKCAINVVENAIKAHYEFDEERLQNMFDDSWLVDLVDPANLYNSSNISRYIDPHPISNKDSVAAVICHYTNPTGEAWPFIALYENGFPGPTTHGKPTLNAQLLLGKSVPVKLVAENCAGKKAVVDRFLVHFINPLVVQVTDPANTLKDLLAGGSSVHLSKSDSHNVIIKEAYGSKRTVVPSTNANLKQWYATDVDSIKFDFDHLYVNIKDGQKITEDDVTKWGKLSDLSDKYKIEPDNLLDPHKVTFYNNSGVPISQEFKIAIPIIVKAKWNPGVDAIEYHDGHNVHVERVMPAVVISIVPGPGTVTP